MTKESLEARLKQLIQLAQQSIADHNSLLGRVAEVEEQLKSFAEKEFTAVEGTLITAAETEITNLGNQAVASVEAKAGQVIDAEVTKL